MWWPLVKKSSMPFIIQLAFVSPGCTLALITTPSFSLSGTEKENHDDIRNSLSKQTIITARFFNANSRNVWNFTRKLRTNYGSLKRSAKMSGILYTVFVRSLSLETAGPSKFTLYNKGLHFIHSSSEPSLHHHQSFGRKFQVAHRASTSSLHSCQSFTSREACSQIRFTARSSASVVLLQVDLGRHLFLLPSGIHLSATCNHTFRLLIMQAETRVLWKAEVYLATMW